MNYSHQWREILGRPGYASLENFENLGLCISCFLEQELGYLNRTETQIAAEFTQNSGKSSFFS